MTDYVTYHARVRYLQRVMGIDVEEYRREISIIDEMPLKSVTDHEVFIWCCCACGIDPDMIDQTLSHPTLARAANAGAKAIMLDGVKYVFSKERKLVTVYKEKGLRGGERRKERNRRNRREWREMKRRAVKDA